MPAQIRVEDRPAERTRLLLFSQPARKNALDVAALEALRAELSRAVADKVRALVLAGEGGTFCAGSDLASVGEETDRLHANQSGLPDAALIRACESLEAAPLPIVAAIDGPAFGAGAELACACDLRVASPSARFSLPPARLGLVYSPEGIARVTRLLGLAQAKRLFFTAAVIDANEALRIGLCEELVEDASALPRALALAAELAKLSPRSHAGMKRAFSLLASAVDREAQAELTALRREAFTSADAREGRAAFLERRAPKFDDL